ncbi:CaiF/GrlA family transcriptional regulator [Salmonella enterica subsp. enterica serovar Newport]|nr:CaiF/GrlA family transcriptional regulator [Salmonella enterica subsp. enterica serovar Newport]EAV2672495.1 CaiF/GrlA family transcriptional regulator [Salmonella enterica]EHB5299562.1 CaiF/GrlA family transcriptional regulator [Salmonella enterica subsp. enterica serovar Sandiego]EBS2365767.1 CaiF/GrlA family transcriptional regulator [Salmonella enterica subsp. enterica serovar Newport]EBS4395698.1 CaiF/GrlA family transcriptional regulator [Salmonella enterica subsp. enterica serovar New
MNNKLTDIDDCKTLPTSVSQYHNQPLYIIIALWCKQQNRWINRNDIAKAFSISARRASFQLSYIINRKSSMIKLRLRKQIISHHPCNEIWVKEVNIESLNEKTKEPSIRKNESKSSNMGAYRSRVGNGMSIGRDFWNTLTMLRSPPTEGDK